MLVSRLYDDSRNRRCPTSATRPYYFTDRRLVCHVVLASYAVVGSRSWVPTGLCRLSVKTRHDYVPRRSPPRPTVPSRVSGRPSNTYSGL